MLPYQFDLTNELSRGQSYLIRNNEWNEISFLNYYQLFSRLYMNPISMCLSPYPKAYNRLKR